MNQEISPALADAPRSASVAWLWPTDYFAGNDEKRVEPDECRF
jgi:hypothetical protein